MRRLCQFVVVAVLATSSAAGYYHFVRYASRTGPFTPIYERFDLNALVNKTVYFYVSEDRPALAASDSYEAVIGQVRQALAAWNGIPTSDLRVAYGGTGNLPAAQAQAPGGEIVFEELPPGVVGMGGPSTRLPQTGGFIAIVRSRVILPLNLAARPSSGEAFFNTLVHEIGHALGLQHTLTGAAMSEGVTRSTTRARPLASDDEAGLSVLYPAASFATATGTMSGRVTTPGGRPLHLVSVVAVNPGGAVVSALTAPDGTYKMEGLPPGTYLVYAHALPPATQVGLGPANLVLPTDEAGAQLAATGPVETQFHGGVKDANSSTPVVVNGGAAAEGVDIRVAERASLPLYDVTTYSFPGPGLPAILPAFVNASRLSGTLLAFGPGLSANIRNVGVAVIGGGVQVRNGHPTPYGADPRFAEIELDFSAFVGTGARHLMFALNGETYVRPGAVQLVTRPGPLVREVTAETEAGNGIVLSLSGDNLAAESRVYFDGVAATIRGFDEATGRLRVTPPPGVAGRQAVITVYNSDGQSSVFMQPSAPATFSYPAADAPALTVSPGSGRAGRDVTVEIQGTNTNFVDGQTVVGFGTPDVVTRRVWVLSPTRLVAVISISLRAALAAGTVSVTSGLQITTLAGGFRIDAANPTTAPVISFQALLNSATLQPRVSPGSLASLLGSNLTLGGSATASLPLPTTLGGATVTINDQAVPLLAVSPTQINLQIPFTAGPGPVVVRVSNGAEFSAPMIVQIDPLAPGLFRAVNAAGGAIDANSPARVGETIVLFGTGLGQVTPQGTLTSTLRVLVGGVELTPSYAGLAPGTVGVYQINVPLVGNVPAGAAVPVVVSVDGQASNVLTITVRAP